MVSIAQSAVKSAVKRLTAAVPRGSPLCSPAAFVAIADAPAERGAQRSRQSPLKSSPESSPERCLRRILDWSFKRVLRSVERMERKKEGQCVFKRILPSVRDKSARLLAPVFAKKSRPLPGSNLASAPASNLNLNLNLNLLRTPVRKQRRGQGRVSRGIENSELRIEKLGTLLAGRGMCDYSATVAEMLLKVSVASH